MREDIALHSASPIFAWLALLLGLYFSARRPIASAFLPLSTTFLGGIQIFGDLTYGRATVLLGILTMASLLVRRSSGGIAIATLLSGSQRWFMLICLAIIAKIGLDTAVLGLDDARKGSLISALNDTMFPLVIVLVALIRRPAPEVEREMVLGMMIYPTIALLGPLWISFQNGLLASVIAGTDRFAIGKLDTINSARVISYGAMASLIVAGPWLRLPKAIRCLALVAGTLELALAALTGSRQYLISLGIFLILLVFRLTRSTLARLAIALVGLPLLAYALLPTMASGDFALIDRFSLESLDREIAEGRGEVWQRVFQSTIENPLLGTGFRNFGQVYEVLDTAGNVHLQRDTAHGVIQDVFAEHGTILGTAYFIGACHLILTAARAAKAGSLRTPLALGLISLQAALLFSSAFLNATPVYLLMLLCQATRAQRPTEHSDRSHGSRLPPPNPHFAAQR